MNFFDMLITLWCVMSSPRPCVVNIKEYQFNTCRSIVVSGRGILLRCLRYQTRRILVRRYPFRETLSFVAKLAKEEQDGSKEDGVGE